MHVIEYYFKLNLSILIEFWNTICQYYVSLVPVN